MDQEPDEKQIPERENSAAVEDINERGYYYDDAHGYENFDPEDKDDEAEDGSFEVSED